MRALTWIQSLVWVSTAVASFPPEPQNVITKRIDNLPGASISYKETHICGSGAKAYAGYVHKPSTLVSEIQDENPYNISTFFWYFRARNSPWKAPTAIYLAGGPGQSSVFGATRDGGPCYVFEDSNSTKSNPWSWNENVNMLYVDQPVTPGFSYSEAVRSTLDLLWDGSDGRLSPIVPLEDYDGSVPAESATFLHGTLPAQEPTHVAGNSVIAARALWYFAQLWFTHFPEHRTRNDRISLAGNSYGGYFVSTSMAHFQRQNERIEAREIDGKCLHLDTAVITNGAIDLLIQAEWYPEYAFNNTYGIQAISEEAYEEARNNYNNPSGCRDRIEQCRALGDLSDPEELALNQTVNTLCAQATQHCYETVIGPYAASGRSPYDLTSYQREPYPLYTTGWANRAWVQQALGVPVNFTANSLLARNVFGGDPARRAGLKDIKYLLSRGIKVALIYGDRDYQCPWLGGEKLSLAADWSGAARYRQAGYEEIRVNSSYVGGVAKQHGSLSFSRVLQAGHAVQWYQPETVFEIFNRVVFDRDVPSGRKRIGRRGRGARFATTGPVSSYGWTNELPEPTVGTCYTYDVWNTCTGSQIQAIANGTAEVEDFVVVRPSWRE